MQGKSDLKGKKVDYVSCYTSST